jgi:CubicO group peptidase (beta-lactamase class C family)
MNQITLLLLTFGLTKALYCQTIPQQLDSLMTAYCKVNQFNGSVLVSQKGRILLAKGYGIKNDSAHTLNDANSIYQLYSVTKVFTATVILKLAELKKLSVLDKLSRYYPAIPWADSVSIEQLLTHTAGVYEYTRGNTMKDQSEQSFLQFISTRPLEFIPGTNWQYSNSGYWLLGFIIKKVTGISYEAAVQQYIFDPLHMQQSGFHYKLLSHKNKTTGYAVFTNRKKQPAVVYDPPGPFAAGAIYATAGDLFKFHKGLQTHRLISQASLEQAYTPRRNHYGYGWEIDSVNGQRIVSHSGGAAGFRSNFARVPAQDICIVLLNNHESAPMTVITQSLLNVLWQQPYTIPVNKQVPIATLDSLTGAYFFKNLFTLYVTAEDGQLTAQASRQSKIALLAEKPNYFFAPEARMHVAFVKDTTGAYNELVLQADDQRTFKGPRIPATWGLTGTATAKGWNDSIPDILLQPDPLHKGIWSVKNITLTTGVFLFRLNNDWGYHYGDNGQDLLLDMFGEDIKTTAGTYDIILDLTDPVEPTCKLIRRS